MCLYVDEVPDKVGAGSNVEEPNHHLVEYGVGAHMLPQGTGCCTGERGIKKQRSSGCDNNSTTQNQETSLPFTVVVICATNRIC